jgi:hypothetical protein
MSKLLVVSLSWHIPQHSYYFKIIEIVDYWMIVGCLTLFVFYTALIIITRLLVFIYPFFLILYKYLIEKKTILGDDFSYAVSKLKVLKSASYIYALGFLFIITVFTLTKTSNNIDVYFLSVILLIYTLVAFEYIAVRYLSSNN